MTSTTYYRIEDRTRGISYMGEGIATEFDGDEEIVNLRDVTREEWGLDDTRHDFYGVTLTGNYWAMIVVVDGRVYVHNYNDKGEEVEGDPDAVVWDLQSWMLSRAQAAEARADMLAAQAEDLHRKAATLNAAAAIRVD